MTYTADKIGRTTTVGAASGFGSQTSFATGIGYRAFGGVKSMTYSTATATAVSVTYDNRLRPATYEADSSANAADIHNKTYTYNNDGSTKQATNTLDADYSQKYEYDFAGRLKANKMGGLVSGTAKYDQTLGYDAFGNLTSRSTTFDGTTKSFTAGYTNNRKTSGGFGAGDDTFDAAGNVVANVASYTPVDARTWKFDAAGRTSDWEETTMYAGTTRWDQGEEITFDGDGRAAKRNKRTRLWASPPSGWVSGAVYHLYSSVLGREVAELDSSGQWKKRKIHFNGTEIAEQTPGWGVVFKHTDPVAGSEIKTDASGEMLHPEIGRTERAALGEAIPTVEPEVQQPPLDYWDKRGGTHNPQYGGCASETLSIFGPMPCNPSEAFMGHLQNVYGPAVLWVLRDRDGLGSGGVGADGESTDGPSVRGLRLVRDPSGFAIGDFRYSWVIDDLFNYSSQIDCRQAAMNVVTSKFRTMWSAPGRMNLLMERVGNLLDGAQWAGFTIAETASYLATAEQETEGFNTMYETNWNSQNEDNYTYFERNYGNRPDLGNVTSGDGWHYRGRGYVNLTGKYNYDQANVWATTGRLGGQFQQGFTVANDNINMFAEDLVLSGRTGALYLQSRNFGSHLTGNQPDFKAARRLVNPKETSATISKVAARAGSFWNALSNCK